MSIVCKLARLDSRAYTNQKNAIINNRLAITQNGKLTILKDEELIKYFTDSNTRFGQNHIQLSNAQRLEVINQIEQELNQQGTIASEVQERFDAIKKNLGSYIGGSVLSAAVNEENAWKGITDGAKENLPKNTPITKIDRNSALLFPVLSNSLNQHALNYIYSAFKELCIWDEKLEVIVEDNETLTQALINFRNQQFEILKQYVGDQTKVTISEAMSDEEVKAYNGVLEKAWSKIVSEINGHNGIIDAIVTSGTWANLISPVVAFYVLQDFDTLLKHVLSSYITIDPKQMGTLTNSDEKYKLKEKKKVNGDFEDSFKSSDGENLADNLLTTFITSTVVPETGMPLAKDFKTTLLVELKNVLENVVLDAQTDDVLTELQEILNNENATAYEKVSRLQQVLATTNRLTEKLGLDKCRALSNRMSKFLTAYDKQMANKSSKARASMDRNYNIGVRLLDGLSQGITAFTTIDSNGTTSTVSSFSKKKSKQYVRDRLKQSIKRNADQATLVLYDDLMYVGDTTATGITDVYSDNVKDYLTRITGINFWDTEILEKFSTPDGLQAVREFLQDLNYFISTESALQSGVFKNVDEGIDNVLNRLSKTASYIRFSNMVVSDNEYVSERIFSLDGKNELPKTTITTLTTQFNSCKNRLKKLVGSNSNIVLANPSLVTQTKPKFDANHNVIGSTNYIQHISFINEVEFLNGRIVPWVKLKVNEILEAQLGGLFLANLLENGIVSFQIEAAADKNKVPIGNYNLDNELGQKIISEGVDEAGTEKTTSTLYRAYEQAHGYYGVLEQQIVNNWNTIVKELVENPPVFTNIKQIQDYLTEKVTNPDGTTSYKNDLNVKQLHAVALAHPEISFQKEILYTYDKNGHLLINNSLIREINCSKDYDTYKKDNEIAYQSWVSHLSGVGNPKCNINQYLMKYRGTTDENVRTKLKQLFGLTGTDADSILDSQILSGTFDLTAIDPETKTYKWDRFLRKYQAMYRLFHEADTELFQKHYWCHGANAGNIVDERTKRIQKYEKRNNSLSATFSPLMLGLRYGVGARVRIAQVESLRTYMTTMFGDRDELKAHDGAIWSTMVLRVLEQNSSLQVDMAKTAKTITLCPDGFGITQLKCADYTMDNAFIRNSIPANNNSNQTMGAKVAMYKMLGVAQLGDVFYDNFADAAPDGNVDLGLSQVIYDFGGRQAYLKNYYVYDNGELQAEWVYLDNGETVDTNTVGTALGLQVNEDGEALIVNNLYDLWKFFGAEYSMGYNEEGEVVFNDASQEYVAYLMSEFDPSLKEVMIGKLVDPESSKSTQTLTNSRTDAFTEAGADLVTTTIESQQYGPQQDHTHETEESTIPALTQVITAIAFNGQNPELVQQMYELLGKLTTIELEDLNFKAQSTNKTAFYRKIGQMIYNNLKDNNIISNAQMILTNTLQELTRNSDLFAPRALPLSDNNLFHKATAQMLSKLNKAIRQRFSGVSVIQNPAQGIIGIYEDAEGVTYLKTDLIEAAKEWAGKNKKTYINNDDLIQQYLTEEPRFRDTKLTDANMHKLTIGYFVRKGLTDSLGNAIIDPVTGEQQKSDLIEVDTPEKLWQIYDEIRDAKRPATYYLVHNTQRNLATTQISWTEGIQHKNIWMLESTKQLITQRVAYKGKWPKSTFVSDWHDANIDGLRNGDNIGTYYYATSDDYRSGNKTYVTNITYRGGEEILPKIFREKMGLRHSLSKIKRQGANYFKDLIESRWKLDASLEGKIVGKMIALSGDNYDIVFKFNDSVTNNGYIERFDDQKKARILDADGTEIVKMYLPEDSEATVNINHIAGGKKIITIGISIDEATKQQEYEKILKGVKYNQMYHGEGYDGVIDTLHQKRDLTPAEIEDRAKKMYASFELMLKTISARIPSQSFQSFLSNETVGFTEDDSNNGYMNLYEMMFQGSDYDIDHAYTMIFDVSDSGIIEGNVFSHYDSPESLMESLLLPQPDKDLVIKKIPAPKNDDGTDKVGSVNAGTFAGYDPKNYASVKAVLQKLRDIKARGEELIYYYPSDPKAVDLFGRTVERFNAYNETELSEQTIKNSVMAGIRKASSDLANLKASQVPMISKPVNDAIDESVKNFGSKNETVYMDADPTHIADFQFQGSIGKEGVGISANSIKATGAIQQVTNWKHQQEKKKGLGRSQDLNLTLRFQFTSSDGQITRDINEHLVRVPNTPISEGEYEALLKANFGSDYVSHPLMPFYVSLVAGETVVPVNARQTKMQEAYKALQDAGTSTPSFEKVMYEMVKNEQNVADMESIFISLCTDNAKELQLYRIAGVPELLNIPLTMIALGMEIQDVTDICVKYLNPVLTAMSKSRISSREYVDVNNVISSFVKNTVGAEQESWRSLQKVAAVAQQLRYISGYFKINQGTSVRYAETYDFLANFDRMMQGTDTQNGVKVNGQLVTKESIFENDNAEYRQAVINEYQRQQPQLKHLLPNGSPEYAFNVAEIVFNSPHFFSQLKACYDVYTKANDNIAVSNISSKLAKSVADTHPQLIKELGTDATTKIIQVVQNYALTNALKQLPHFAFRKQDTIERYGNWDTSTRNDIEIGVSNYRKAQQFLNFMERGVIPYIKREFPENFFVKMLEMDTRTGRYSLPFPTDTKGDMRTKMDINQASLTFMDLCPRYSGIKTLDQTEITLGDLLYLYTTIVNQNRMCTTSNVIYSALGKGSKLHLEQVIDSTYAELDRTTGIATAKLDEVQFPYQAAADKAIAMQTEAQGKLDEIANTVKPYILARLGKIKEAAPGLLYDLQGNNFPLYTMIPPRIKSESGVNVNNLVEALNQMASISQTGSTITRASYDANNKIVTIELQTPTRFDKSSTRTLKVHDIEADNNSTLYYDALIELQDAIDANTQSLFYSINESLLGQYGHYSTDQAVKDFVEAKDLDSKVNDVEGFKNWLNAKQDIVILQANSYMKTHVEDVGGRKIVVLNSMQLETMNKKDRTNLMLDMYLDTLSSEKGTSEQSRLAQLVQLVTKVPTNVNNLTEVLARQDVQNELKKHPFVESWVEYTQKSSIPQEVKDKARLTYSLYEEAVKYADLYYTTANLSNPPQVGDMYSYIGNTYIYLGDVNNKMILQNINDPSDITFENHVNRNSAWKKLQVLKPTMNYNALNPDAYKDKSYLPEATIKKEDIKIGDLIVDGKESLLVLNVVFDQRGDNYVPQYVVYNERTQDYSLKEFNNTNEVVVRKLDEIDHMSTNANPNFNVRLSDGKHDARKETKALIASKMRYGTKFTVKGSSDVLTFSKYTNGFIQTTNNAVYPVEQLDEVSNFELSSIFPNHLYDIMPMKYTYRNPNPGSSMKVEQVLQLIQKQPMFRRGLGKAITEIAEHVDRKNSNIVLSPMVTFNGTSYNMFAIPNDTEVYGPIKEETNVERNDLIETLPQSGKGYTMAEVLEAFDDDTLLVLESEQRKNEETKKMETTKTIKLVSKKSVSGSILHKRNRNTQNHRLRKAANVQIKNPNDKVEIMLDFLAKKFNTIVEVVQLPTKDKKGNEINQWFARVNDGVVQINMGRYNEKMGTQAQYILQKGVHEFTHLVLADLLANNPDEYMRLYQMCKNNTAFRFTDDSGVYKTEQEQIEEQLVHVINDLIFLKGQNDQDALEVPKDIEAAVRRVFADFFGLEGDFRTALDGTKSLDSLQLTAFKDTTRRSITQLRDRRLRNELIENTKVECQ